MCQVEGGGNGQDGEGGKENSRPVTRHTVTLNTPTGQHVVVCSEQLSILDTAAAQGIVLPAVCRGGACTTCVAKLVHGTAPDQSEQTYLSQEDLDAGYILLCVAYAQGDCSLDTHKMAEYTATL